MSDELNLNAIERRANAATPGPWCCLYSEHEGPIVANIVDGCVDCTIAWINTEVLKSENNAEFIAAARTDIPALITRVHELIEQISSMEHDLAVLQGDHD